MGEARAHAGRRHHRSAPGAGDRGVPTGCPQSGGEVAMRYLSMVKSAENQGLAPQALQDAMARLIADSLKDGSLVQTGGLGASASGFRVRSAGGELTGTDGPVTGAKGGVGGHS